MPHQSGNHGGKRETVGHFSTELDGIGRFRHHHHRASGAGATSLSSWKPAARKPVVPTTTNLPDPIEKGIIPSRLPASPFVFSTGFEPWHSQSSDNRAPFVGDYNNDSQGNMEQNAFSWKNFRAIAHMGLHRFHVIFSLHVHTIEGLPASMDGLRLTVRWNRKEEGLQTMPSTVLQGVARFDETLRQRCTIYGSTGADHGIKYESKLFSLSVVALAADELELGTHHLDFSRLLPEFPGVEERPADRTANFELAGMAKGSTLAVNFSYDLVHYEATEESNALLDGPNSTQGSSPRSMPSNSFVPPSHSQSGNGPHNHLPIEHLGLDEESAFKSPGWFTSEASPSPVLGLSGLHGGLGTELKPNFSRVDEHANFTFPPTQLQDSQARHSKKTGSYARFDFRTDSIVDNREAVVEFSSGSAHNVDEKFDLFGPAGKKYQERNNERSWIWEKRKDGQSGVHSTGGQELTKERNSGRDNIFTADSEVDLDEEVDLVTGEFLNLLDVGGSSLNSDCEPDSPRARLLRQFEQEALFEGGISSAFNEAHVREADLSRTLTEQVSLKCSVPSNMEVNQELDDALELASIMEAAESELQKATQTMRSKSRAKMLEDAETEALMQQWGLSEKSFESSPPKSLRSFGNPAKWNVSGPPPLGRGLGPVINLKDGGTLRSMSFPQSPKSKANSSLVMQVSRPVVVPSAMGSSALDILRHLASFGVDNLAMQAMTAMPLEDIAGKTVEEITGAGNLDMHGAYQMEGLHRNRNQSTAAVEAQGRLDLDGYQVFTSRHSDTTNLEAKERPSEQTPHVGNYGKYDELGMHDDCVSLRDLAPLAMQNIEALAIDGLKIQADMAEEEPPSYLDAAAWGVLEDQKEWNRDRIGMSQGVAGIHFGMLQTEKDVPSEVKHGDPLSMAITLEEWSRMDAGVFDDVGSNDKTLAILAAHNAHHPEWELTKWEETKGYLQGKGHPRKKGIMGNTLMIAMLVQLRDPFHNYEPVGAPMLTLIQAERIMVPPKPRIGRRVSTKGNSEEEDELENNTVQTADPQFKITGVHMSGLKTEDNDEKKSKAGEALKKGWGNQKQQQSGSRWLIAQGMGKSSKHALLKSKPTPSKTKVKPGETLWSISARVHGSGEKWRDIAALNPHIRNPDVIFANDTIRTK